LSEKNHNRILLDRAISVSAGIARNTHSRGVKGDQGGVAVDFQMYSKYILGRARHSTLVDIRRSARLDYSQQKRIPLSKPPLTGELTQIKRFSFFPNYN
jgi:hypothetical protein